MKTLIISCVISIGLFIHTIIPSSVHASEGQTVFIPIAVGDITTFIPIMPTTSQGSIAGTSVDGKYLLSWSAVSNASYYQIVITDENGNVRIIRVQGTIYYDLADLTLGNSTIAIQACNSANQCGVRYVAGTVSRRSRVSYQHTDMLGSPVMKTDVAGNVISRSVYEPFGKRIGGDKEGIGYTGHLQDKELGLTYMQARYYDPLIGRFYSNDPIGFRDVHSFNRYVYANNNPYKYIDPDGKASLALGIDVEAILPIGGGGQVGGFINYDKGVITIGTFTETKISAGEDVGASVSLQYSGGGLSDFQGHAVTGEADIGILTYEPGATLGSDGLPKERILGFEIGLGLPAGGSGNYLDTTIEDSISIDISDLIEAVEEALGQTNERGCLENQTC